MPGNFSFVIPDKLAGSARPGRHGDLRADLAGLAEAGVGAVVSLTEEPLDARLLEETGFRSLHLPIPDFEPPTPEQIDRFVAFVDACLADGVAVLAHCGAGIGRTGTMLACYLVSRGMKPDTAIRKIRRERPGSVETPDQERSVSDYYRRLKQKRDRHGR